MALEGVTSDERRDQRNCPKGGADLHGAHSIEVERLDTTGGLWMLR